ncbi:hypothetical protein EK21DRAFT_82344, partial [Setomelanomma holmii]
LLDFVPMRGSHTGESMAREVLKVLSDTAIKPRLLAITCDNASNNTTVTRSLETLLQSETIEWDAR